MKITINKTGNLDAFLWNNGWRCWLITKIFGFYIIGYKK